MVTQPVFQTERLVLRPLDPRDDGQFWRLRSDPLVIQWADGAPWPNLERAREERLKLQVGMDACKWYFWALSEGPAGPLIGTVCLWNFTTNRKDCEIGFELFPSRQGKGLMTEAVGAVLSWAWSALFLEGVSALTNRENLPSVRFLQRCGFVSAPIPESWELVEVEAENQVYYRLDRPRFLT